MKPRLVPVVLLLGALTACTIPGRPVAADVPGADSGPRTVQLGVGDVVVDGEGYSLYRFDKDTAVPSKATCVDECAAGWPPVLVEEKITFRNLDPTRIGTVTRPDGSRQVTIGGWPVYRHAADELPGQDKGQGIDGSWFAVAPNGTRAAGR